MAYRSAIAARSPASGSARERLQVQGNSMLDGRMYLTQELRRTVGEQQMPNGANCQKAQTANGRELPNGATPWGRKLPENATAKRRIVQC